MPRLLEALPCGSASTSRTRRSFAARHAARLTAVVVLPTPPFWFATAKIRARSPIAPYSEHPYGRPPECSATLRGAQWAAYPRTPSRNGKGHRKALRAVCLLLPLLV